MLDEVLKSCKKMISADIKADLKQIKELVDVILELLTEVPCQNLKYNVKQACIFNLILVGIPSSLILSVKNRGRRGFLLNSYNLLSMKKIFVEDTWWLRSFT